MASKKRLDGRKPTKDANGSGSIWSYALADGSLRWAVQLSVLDLTKGGRRRATKRGFGSQAAAVAYRADNSVKALRGTLSKPSDLTVADYLDEWLPLASLRQATRAGYRTKINHHVKPYIGSKRLDKLSRQNLEKLYRDLYTSGRADHRSGEGLSLATVRQVHSILSGAFSEAERDGLIPVNPCRHARVPSARSGEQLAHEIHPWTVGELHTFLDATKDERNGALWSFLAWTGLRRGEALGVRWTDLDLGSEPSVSIRRSVSSSSDGNGSKPVEITPTKSRLSRQIDLDTQTAAELLAHRERQATERTSAVDLWTDAPGGALVFPRDTYRLGEGQHAGGPLKPDSVSRAFDSAVARHGLRRVRLHDLRHGWATMALLSGTVHIKVVQERLGHSTIAVTMNTYSHVIAGQQRLAAETVRSLVG